MASLDQSELKEDSLGNPVFCTRDSEVYILRQMEEDADVLQSVKDRQQGVYGFDIFTDTAAHDGDWYAIEILNAAAFTSLLDQTDVEIAGNSVAANGSTMPAGFINRSGALLTPIEAFTRIHLASGAVIAYRNAPAA